VRWKNINHITQNPKIATLNSDVIARLLQVDKAQQKFLATNFITNFQAQNHR
jgi:hypothetical protein